MRVRLLALAVVLALPGLSAAQRIPVRPPTIPIPKQPPKEPPAVAREMNFRRMRWSSETFQLSSLTYMPAPSGAMTRYMTMGAGTHYEYRLGMADRRAFTVDMAGGASGNDPDNPLLMLGTELGGRFYSRPHPDGARYYTDARLSYSGTLNAELSGTSTNWNAGSSGAGRGQHARGFGVVAGVGAEVPFTVRFSFYGGLSLARSRMTIFGYDDVDRNSNLLDLLTPGEAKGHLWATSLRMQVGFRYNPVRYLTLEQNPWK
jgi:hypothetical protein